MKKNLLFLFAFLGSASLFAQPIITQNPQSINVCLDSCNSLSVQALGDSLSYYWQQDSMGIWVTDSNANANAYEVCLEASASDSSQWRVIVEDAQGLKDTSINVYVVKDSCLAPTADFEFDIFSGDSVCFTNKSKNATSVLWNFGNGNQSSMLNPCQDYTDPQIWIVRLYVFNDYGSDEIELNVDMLSVEDFDKQFSLFPNPTQGVLNVSSSSVIDLIQVYDLKGSMLKSFTPNKIGFLFDLGDFNNGIYVLQIESNGKLEHHKIVLHD